MCFFVKQHILIMNIKSEGAPDAGFIGIETPSGVYGDKGNIKLRFDPAYMSQAADGKL
jgi:NitT/TauT family transport system substrate-binding protein